MSKDARVVLAFVGIALLAVGLVVGLIPVHASGVSCGSAFRGSNDFAEVEDIKNAMRADAGIAPVPEDLSAIQHQCQTSRSDRLPLALVPLVLGAVLLLGAGVAS